MNVIDDYMSGLDELAASHIRVVIDTIRAAAPMASETISYGMPTFKINGKNAVHCAAHARHTGLYPGPDAIVTFGPELVTYKHSKGAVQFPYSDAVPIELIRRIVELRVAQLTTP